MKLPGTLVGLAVAVLAASGVAAHRLVPEVPEIRPGMVGGGWWAEDPGGEGAGAPRSGRSFRLFPSSGFAVLDGVRLGSDHVRRFGLFCGGVRQAELVLPLGGAGEILAVVDGGEGLVLVSGSPVDQGSLANSSLTVWRAGQEVTGSLSLYGGGGDLQGYEGRLLLWRPEDAGAYLAAEYTVEPNLALADPAGHPIHGPPSAFTYLHTGQGDVVWSAPTDSPVLTASAVGNDRFLHARPWIDRIALYDYRARFYDPATSTFLELDPLGPVDSPNLYQAFGFDGLNVTDPYGLKLRWYDWFGIVADAVTSTNRDVGKVGLGIVTLGVSMRMEAAYERGEVHSFGDSVRVAADAVTNAVTLGMRDQYERGANTAEAAWEVSGLAGVERGSRKIGEGIGLGDTELALQGVGEFAGGTGQFAGWVAGATALGKRTVSAASMDELTTAAQRGMQEFGRGIGGTRRVDTLGLGRQGAITEHPFSGGATHITTLDSLMRARANYRLFGRESGLYVAPTAEIDQMLTRASSRTDIEISLGLDPGTLADSPIVRIDVPDPFSLNLRLPDPTTGNALHRPGTGLTLGGLHEGVIDPIPHPKYPGIVKGF